MLDAHRAPQARASFLSFEGSKVNELKKLLDRPIAFHRPFVKITGSVNGALMLSQAFYWANRTNDPDGWFYKTQQEWEEETGLTRREQDGARAKLRSVGVIEEKLVGVPARLYYRVNMKALVEAMHETAKLDAPDPQPDAPNSQTVGTEPPNSMHETAKLLKNRDYTETTQRLPDAATPVENPKSPQVPIKSEITSHMVAKGVIEELMLAGKDLAVNLEAIAQAELKRGGNPDDIRDRMIAAWRLYEQEKSKLEYVKGPAKFFGDGDWRDPKSWPYPKGSRKKDPFENMKFINSGGKK